MYKGLETIVTIEFHQALLFSLRIEEPPFIKISDDKNRFGAASICILRIPRQTDALLLAQPLLPLSL